MIQTVVTEAQFSSHDYPMFDDAHIHTTGQIETFLDATDIFALQLQCPKREKAQWIYERLVRFKYSRLGKREKSIV